MRREGKIRGSFVRTNKSHEFDYTLGNRTNGKPTNASKVSSTCTSNKVQCSMCHSATPCSKALCKTKSMLKVHRRDISYKLEDFSLKCNSSRPGPALGMYYGSLTQDSGYSYDYESEEQESLDQLEYCHSAATRTTMGSFLRDVCGDAGTPDSYPDEEALDEDDGLESSRGTPHESHFNRTSATDDDCSWSLVDSSDTDQGSADLDEINTQ
ncbi:hypothetical protein R1sor_026845 [Riccia sorocarpa]|uniref:Uncharacterized protein n=1 Tax=Riccia sorocarpa TaxID=122646 RepID=A0ABD3GFG2_9MARC